MTDKAIAAAQKRLRDIGKKLKMDADRLLATLGEAAACGIEIRHLDIETIKVRYLTAIPDALERKAAALLPKGSAQ